MLELLKEALQQANEVKALQERLLREDREQVLRKNFVDSGKVTPEEFDKIKKADSTHNMKYAMWLLKVFVKEIKPKGAGQAKMFFEDIPKFDNYFKAFERIKHKFSSKDINAFTYEKFKKEAPEVINKFMVKDTGEAPAGNLKDKYDDLFLGEAGEFLIFEVPQSASNDVRKRYCSLGAEFPDKTEWCTLPREGGSFEHYIKDGALYVIVNKNDMRERYQFQFETGQFMDKNDVSIFGT